MLALFVRQLLRDFHFDVRVEVAALVGFADRRQAVTAQAESLAALRAGGIFNRSVFDSGVTTSTSPPSTAVGTGTRARV